MPSSNAPAPNTSSKYVRKNLGFVSSSLPGHPQAFCSIAYSHGLLRLVSSVSHHVDKPQPHLLRLCPSFLPVPESATWRAVVHARFTRILFKTPPRDLILRRLFASQWSHGWTYQSRTHDRTQSGIFQVSLSHHKSFRPFPTSVFAIQFSNNGPHS